MTKQLKRKLKVQPEVGSGSMEVKIKVDKKCIGRERVVVV